MNIHEKIKESLCGLKNLTIKDCEKCYEVKWQGAFGILVHKESTSESAEVHYEANPYNPVTTMVPWENLESWCVKMSTNFRGSALKQANRWLPPN
jgi:hypothetical protein